MTSSREGVYLINSPATNYRTVAVADEVDLAGPEPEHGDIPVPKKKRSLYISCCDENGDPMPIDYVLVYKKDPDDSRDVYRRELYHKNLREAGLILEEEESIDGSLCVVKVHGPWDVLTTYAELMKMKMPLKNVSSTELDIDPVSLDGPLTRLFSKCPNPFAFEETYYQGDDNYFTCPFRKDKQHLFQIKDKKSFFTNSERSRIVYEVLMRTKWEDESDKFGIRRLLGSGTYMCAYPLHEGPYSVPQEIKVVGADNERHLLYEIWVRPRRWYKFQPLDLIRKYFGEKIGIYFAWLGLYTAMLIPVSILGLVVVIYGAATMANYTPRHDICNANGVGNYTMCPLCDRVCQYTRLKQSCLYSTISYLFDNPVTIFFAVVMSVWGTLFLELWKRQEHEIQYDWDVQNYEEEEAVRPEFESRCRYVRLNPVTGNQEPYIPIYLQCPRYLVSIVTVLFMMSLVIGFLLGVIIYRVAMVTVFYSVVSESLKSYAKIITTASAALVNLVAILILNRIYRVLAIVLTNWERPRTETDYDNALTFKMYCFQFVNFYSSLIYIAFFKGSFVGRPGKYDYTFKYRQEECDPAGCLMELCIQMLIIFLGKQVFNNFIELGIPMIKNCVRRRQLRKKMETGATSSSKDENALLADDQSRPQWERDFPLEGITHLSMFDEYLEMVIQFGFVTLFVSAMPLAPLFALINNIIEIRLDAYKMVTQWRRPYAARAQDIGIWYNILKTIAVISILTNALIIGMTSDAIPRLFYQYAYNTSAVNLEGYVDFSLSFFKTSDFQNRSIPQEIPAEFGSSVEFCRYRGFREPPTADKKYEYTRTFWHIIAARLIFILLFEHLVLFLTTVIAWMIPDMPEKLKVQQKRERYLAQEIMFQADEETLREELKHRQPKPGCDDEASAL